jgi:hypothetical protein
MTSEEADHAPGARPKAAGKYLGEDLIFVISLPRSGSTLLQRLLAGHPDVQTSAETWLMLHPVYGLRPAGTKAEYGQKWAATAVREFLEYYADGEETHLDGIRAYAGAIYGRVREKNGNPRYFLDKTPRYSLIVPDLWRLFPAARFVLLWRNPLAVLASQLTTYMSDGDWTKLGNFRPDLLEAPARLLEARDLLRGAAFELSYESLVQDPEGMLQELCAYLDIEYLRGMQEYGDTPAPRGIMNDPVGVHRHTSPSAENLDKWRWLGRDRQARHFALAYLDALGPTVPDAMGYPAAELRAAIEAEPLQSGPRRVFPWSVAITPWQEWGLKQRVQATWHFAAADRGVIAGAAAAAGVIWRRLTGGLGRLAGHGGPNLGRPRPRGATKFVPTTPDEDNSPP